MNGICRFLILRVRDARGYVSREQLETLRLSYPPASRGRDWNLQIPFSPRAGRTRVRQQRTAGDPAAFVPARVPRAEVEFADSSFSACGTHAGTLAVNSWRLCGVRTRPRPAGVNGIYRFLILRVRDARGYVSRDQLETLRLSYPPASRGREWNLLIPHSPRARTHAGTSAETSWRLYGFRTRPRPAGGSGICRFLILRVRGRTRVRQQRTAGDSPAFVPARVSRA